MISVVVCIGVIKCSQMQDTTKPMAKPASPDARPPTNAARRNSPRTMPSMARSYDRGEQRLDGEVHLEGRPRCPLLFNSDYGGGIRAKQTWVPSLRRRRCLGQAALGERGDRRRPRAISLAHWASKRKRCGGGCAIEKHTS